MHIKIKTLQSKEFDLDVEETDTVLQLKERISASQGEGHDVGQQRLIFKGKILEDGKVLSEYHITEGEFVVLMVSKKSNRPPAPAAQAPSAAPAAPAVAAAPAPVPAAVPTPAAAPAVSAAPDAAPAPAAAPQAPAAPAAPATTGESGLVMGSQFQATVDQLVEMGFPREEAIHALRAAWGNPDRAVEYLMNGIPAGLEQRAGAPPAVSRPAAPAESATGAAAPAAAAAGGAAGEMNPLEFLRNHPQFEQIRQLIQQNPAVLPQLLSSIQAQNPQLFQIIAQNQEAFGQMINEPAMPTGGEGGLSADQMSMLRQMGAQVVQITPEEKEAIDRLEALGFERSRAAEAFLICERNENLAANYLFDHSGEEDIEMNPEEGEEGGEDQPPEGQQ